MREEKKEKNKTRKQRKKERTKKKDRRVAKKIEDLPSLSSTITTPASHTNSAETKEHQRGVPDSLPASYKRQRITRTAV